ncbi:hypothetical protein PMZ80_003138 [Knufia obscura]|uniref:Nephrocystin 3-like N-terminal domain-containing protein n=1 Tax=Knufia obscura TaxID=1635080 RepID=A0ABR0RTC8_9EURO|nr:hypothetical protein PMZ80_003138 [Knufia obscura]
MSHHAREAEDTGGGAGQGDQRGHIYPSISIGGHAQVHLGDKVYHGHRNSTDRASDERNALETRLVQSLAFPNMDARHRHIGHAMPQTGNWLFKRDEYLSWMDEAKLTDHHGFLWIKGKPGSGKSTMMKLALEQAEDYEPNCEVLSYFFNARAPAELERSPLGLYRSLTHQLVSKVPHVRRHFVKTFGTKAESQPICIEWTIKELCVFLVDLLKLTEPLRTTIFIDALDEGRVRDVRDMVNMLEEMIQHARQARGCHLVRICLSSRHYPHISIKKGLSLVLEDQEEHAGDIQKYIAEKLKLEDDDVTEKLQSTMLRKSGNIFLWVVLVIPILNGLRDDGNTAESLLAQLQKMPTELHGLFEDVLFADKTDLTSTVALFQWMLFAFEPLRADTLYVAVRYGSSTFADAAQYSEDFETISRFLLNRSRGLVEIVTERAYNIQSVQFIHESIREFLLGRSGLVTLLPELGSNLEGLSHEFLKACCIRQISGFPPGLIRKLAKMPARQKLALRKELWVRFPLVQYASSYFFEHVGNSHDCGLPQEDFLKSLASGTLQCRSLLIRWAFLDRMSPGRSTGFEHYARQVPLLYLMIERAASEQKMQKLNRLIETWLDTKPDVNETCGLYNTALQVACARGNEKIARRLIKDGANVHIQGGKYENAWLAAIRKFDMSFMELVSQCQCATSQELFQSTLMLLIGNHQRAKTKLLLERGCHVNQVTREHLESRYRYRDETPLTRAVSVQDQAMVEMLVEHGAHVNLANGEQLTPLMLAAFDGQMDILQYLIEQGADVNTSTTHPYGSALFAAMYHRHTEAADVLIAAGAHVNVVGYYLREQLSLLQLVLWLDDRGNDLTFARKLIEEGADVNANYGRVGAPLKLAANHGYMPIVGLLLERGARDDGTALQVARHKGHEAIAKLLEARTSSVVSPSRSTSRSSDTEGEWVSAEEYLD